MSIIACAYLFLPRELTPCDSSLIDQSLREVCDEVSETRKGRYWEARKPVDNVSLEVLVKPTVECLHDCEQELLDSDLPPEDIHEIITITTVLGTGSDLLLCNQLTQLLANRLGCQTSGAKLIS